MTKTVRLRLVAAFLTMAMICTYAIIPSAASSDDIMLETTYPSDEPNMFSFATQSSAVQEGNRYIVTIVRSGDAKDEASVFLETVDVSATYGEDYVVISDDADVELFETNGTILEQATDYEEQSARLEAITEDLESYDIAEYDENTEDETEADDEADEVAETVKDESDESDDETVEFVFGSEMTPDDEDAEQADDLTDIEKSSLALLKEAQTGKETRATSSTEYTSLEQVFLQDTIDNFGTALEKSSAVEIVFTPGETEKTVIVEILDDSDSEGNETFDLVLSEPSDGYGVGSNINCTLTIEDDEPTVHSLLSFSETNYTASSGSVEITVRRTDALYSFCTAMVRTVDAGTAVESVDHSKVDAEITFEPYREEYTFEIPVNLSNDEKTFDVELYDIKGAEAGETVLCTVTLPSISKALTSAVSENENNGSGDEDAVYETAADKDHSFTINLDKTYTVRYNSGDDIGEIYDTDYSPEVRVGDYYFMKSARYGCYSGDSKGAHRESYFDSSLGENGAGYLYWYHWIYNREGSSILYLKGHSQSAFNTRKYQYVSADWEQNENIYGGQTVSMYLHDPYSQGVSTRVRTISVDGKFKRQMSSHILFLSKSNLPVAYDVDLKFSAIDDEHYLTPKTRLMVYGVAAMYRKFKVSLEDPANLTYLDANGNSVAKAPAQVELAEGHGTRYYGQDLEIKVTSSASDNTTIMGTITNYKITVGTSKDNKVTFDYLPSGDNVTNIPFDEEFIKLLDSYTKEVSLENSSTSYYTQISIEPVFSYKDVEVEILEADNGNGTFSDSSLTVGKHTYHVGDTIYLDGTPSNDGVYFSGYQEDAYWNYSDQDTSISGNMNGTGTIFLDHGRYRLKPIFSDLENHIKINVTSNAADKIKILNICPDEYLPDNIKSSGGYVLNTGESDYDYVPKVGAAYSVQVLVTADAPSGKVYRPVFTMSSSSERIVGNVFDFVASEVVSYNVITVDVEEVDVSSMKYFEIDGYAKIPGNSIRSSALNVTDEGAVGVSVIAGGAKSTLYDTSSGSLVTVIDRSAATSDGDGAFSLKGIYASDGDRITMRLTNGDVDTVAFVTLSSAGLSAETIEFTTREYDEDTKTTVDTPVSVSGYVMNCGNIEMPIRSPLAPYVNDIQYSVDTSALNNVTVDSRDNSVPILSAYITIDAYVVLNGCDIKAAVFTRVSKNGEREDLTVYASKIDTGAGTYTFTGQYKLDSVFEDGDMLYISLIDANDRVITTYGEDDDGNPITVTTTEEKRYFDVFTGLTFYIPTLEVEPQVYEINSLTSVEVPILGDMSPNMSTGSLSFTSEKVNPDDPYSPYYYEFLFAPGASDKDKKTANNILTNVINDANKTYDELMNSPEAEKASIESNLMYYFGASDAKSVEETMADKAYKKSIANAATGIKFDVHMVILFSFYFSYDTNDNEYKLAGGQYCVGAYCGLSKTFTWTIYGVPMYVKLSGDFSFDFSGSYATDTGISQNDFNSVSNLDDLLDPDVYLMLNLDGTVSVGVGLCGVISARGIVDVNFVFRFAYGYEDSDVRMDGFLFKFGGGFGVDLLFFSFDYAPSLLTYGSGVYAGVGGGVIDLSDVSAAELQDAATVRSLNTGTSDLSSFGSEYSSGLADGYSVLLSNAAERTRPQLVIFENGKKALFFIGNADDSESVNSQRLYYSVCDTDGTWKTPELVDNDETADTMPEVVKSGNKCLVSWSDANMTFDESTSYADALASLDIAYAIFDAETENMTEPSMVTNDAYMDNNLNFGYSENDMLYCYYLKRDIAAAVTDTDLIDLNATYSTVAYREYSADSGWSDEIYVDIECEGINDPLIIDFNSINAEYNGSSYTLLTYTIDADEDLNTTDDRDVYLAINDLTNRISYYPISITSDYQADVQPRLTRFDGDIYLTWVKDASEFCMINISECVREIDGTTDESGVSLMDRFLTKDPTSSDWYRFTAEELGLDDDEYSSSVYENLYTGDFRVEKKNFTTDEYIDRNIGSYELYNNNDTALYLLWTDNGGTGSDDTSQEVFVSVMEKVAGDESDNAETADDVNEEIDEENFTETTGDDEIDVGADSSWSDAIQVTDFGKTIDEVSAAFDENGTMYFCANLFEQTIDENGVLSVSDNDLIMFALPREVGFEQDEDVTFETAPRPGETTNVGLSIKNTGLVSADGYEVTMSEMWDGTENVVYTGTSETAVLPGSDVSILIPWDVPESIDGLALKISVTELNGAASITVIDDIERYSDISINSASAALDAENNAYLTLELENEGNADAAAVSILAHAPYSVSDKQYGSADGITVPAGETATVTVALSGFDYTDIDVGGNSSISYDVTYGDNTVSGNTMLYTTSAMEITVECGDSLSLTYGDTVSVNAEVMPESVADKTVKYYSNDPIVANVTADGVITACANGTAVITAYNPTTSVSKEIAVTVSGGPEATEKPSSSTVSSGGVSSFSTTATATATPDPESEATAAPDDTSGDALPFKDVSRTDWFYDNVLWAYMNGVMNGVSEDMFEPDSDITRGMLVTTLGRMSEIDTSAYSADTFDDVDTSEYYSPYVSWAAASGIVDGYGDNLFGPDDAVTREQAAKIIMNYESLLGNGPEGLWAIKLDYTDVELIDDWAVEGIMYCTINNIMEGNDDGTFNPLGNILRSECAAVLSRLPSNAE